VNLASFKQLIRQRCGLTFEGVAESPLLEGLQLRMAATGDVASSQYLERIERDELEFHELISLLTINETYFYREPEHLQFMVDRLIPRILASKQDDSPLRILSAGCSTGEEPYSIAIALREKYGESAAQLFTLVAGDIDKSALIKACAGCYTTFSFRSIAADLRERYFECRGEWAGCVRDDVRRQVHFHQQNLLDAQHPPSLQNFDLIFFRNVSIYFDISTRRIIQRHLASLLSEQGYLLMGAAETLANDLGVFNLVEEDGMFYFAKQLTAKSKPQQNLTPLPVRCQLDSEWEFPAVPLKLHRVPAPSSSAKSESPYLKPSPAVPPLLTSPTVLATFNTDEVLQLIEGKRYDQAMAALAVLLEQQSDASTGLLLKAHILLQRKEYTAVEETAQRVLKSEPWSIDAFVLLGLAAKWGNHVEAAVKWFKQAVYVCHKCWPAQYYLAELYRTGNEMEKARRAYRVVLQLLLTAQAATDDGLSIIPLGLPADKVRFLCEHQLAKLDDGRTVLAR